MKIVVVGGGVIGVTTAFMLQERGHSVTVIDRERGPARQTSFANGSLLTPSMPEPWNAPGCLRVLLGSIGHPDAPLQLRVKALPSISRWGIDFIRNSRADRFERNALSNWRLARHSLAMMQSLRSRTGIEYGRVASGTLRIFRTVESLNRAAAAVNRLVCEEVRVRKLSAIETVMLEPALMPIQHCLAGALFCETDEIGNAHQFSVALAETAHALGTDFRYGTEVRALQVRSGKVSAIQTTQGTITADMYILAAGSYSTPLMRNIGIRLPIQPAKGYSVTLNYPPEEKRLRVPIVDDDLHAVVVPLGNTLRMAGTAEFAGYDLSMPAARIENLLNLVRQVLPALRFDVGAATPWCGLRPMCSDGVPIIGHTPLSNLLLNTGHGHLGWTMAAGSADLLADLIDGRRPTLEVSAYAINRIDSFRATQHALRNGLD